MISLRTDRALQASMDMHYGTGTVNRRAEAREVFATLALTAADLAFDAAAIGPDPVLLAVVEDHTAAWVAHLDALSDDEGIVWAAGLRA